MERTNELKQFLQSAYNDCYNAEKFCEHFAVKSQKLGLQGSKRKLRYESVCWHQLKIFLVTDFFDFTGEELSLLHQESAVSTVTGIQDFYNKVLNYYEKLYDKLHTTANSLVSSNGYSYAKKLLEKCDCLMENIKYYRRTISEGDNAGWDLVWLYTHETSNYNLHDSYENKEINNGYPS